MHGEGIALTSSKQQGDGSLRVKMHGAAAVDGDDAVVLPESTAPQAARRVDAIHPHTKARRQMRHSGANIVFHLVGAEVNGP